MQANLPGTGGAVLFLLSLLMTVGIIAGYIVMLVALWRAMKAHESIAQAVIEIARHIERPGTTKHEVDRFTFGE
jgi:hypothetical protein